MFQKLFKRRYLESLKFYKHFYDDILDKAGNVGYGSRLCKNSGAETFCAIIEPGKQRGRAIIASEANFMTPYFVSASKK